MGGLFRCSTTSTSPIDTAKAKKMVADSKRLGFPLLAGSSLPVTWRVPAIEFPLDCVIEEALMVGVGSSDASDYHALEAMQCMVERRRGGESGIKSVQLIQGRCRLEGRRRGPLVQEAAGGGAVALQQAAGRHPDRRPAPGSGQ